MSLSDVYLVIGYYLQNRAEVDDYMQHQRQLAAEARHNYEADHPDDPLRERLLAELEKRAVRVTERIL